MTRQKPPADTEYQVTELPSDAEHWRVAFDSRFLRHHWLGGKPRVVTIVDVKQLKSVSVRAGESKSQLLIFLADAPKPWACNVTNCDLIEQLYGGNPRGWIGKRVELYPTKTQFGRDMVDCMRVREREPAADARPPPASGPAQKQELSVAVKLLLDRMKVATTDDDLASIEDALAEDNTLTPAETQLLIRALKKRTDQLVPQETQS